jgi:hypothetical protein
MNAKDFPVLRSGVAPMDTLGRFRHSRVSRGDEERQISGSEHKSGTHLWILSDL